MDALVGHTLGPYQVVEQIGAGAMATVYKGYHPTMERYVAIKVLPERLGRDSTFRARFLREARTIARLEHRYISPTYDFGEDNGIHYLVMRYVTGGTLGDLIDAGSLTIARAVELIGQIGEALAYAHRQGVIHRDIKPANVLIGQDGNVFLSDFGIAKVVEETLQLTGAGMLMGTPAYMAPEQVQGQGVDARVDIYALGILLYQAVTGEIPFVAETAFSLALMHVHAPPRPPRQLNPTIPEALERVILRAMAKNPADRFQMADDMVAALHTALVGDRMPETGTAPFVAALSTTAPAPLASAQLTRLKPPLKLAQVARALGRYRSSFWLPLLVVLLLGLAVGVAVLAFPDIVQRSILGFIRTTPQPTPQTQIYLPKGMFILKEQEIFVPTGRDVIGAYREAFVKLARQDPRFGPNAESHPNAPPTFIGQPQKIRDEPNGTVYRATMEGLVIVPQQ